MLGGEEDAEMDEALSEDEQHAVVTRLRRDVAEAARTMNQREGEYLVRVYHQQQRHRLALEAQLRSLGGAPSATLGFLVEQARTLEAQVRRSLDLWTRDHPPSQWARGIVGVGPVVTAELRAYTHIEHCPTVGHLWAFAGLDPTKTWEKGQRRPWNPDFKRLAFILGDSFTKVRGKPGDIYGQVYFDRRAYEEAKNLAGDYAEQAAASLGRVGKETGAHKHYAEGRLPPGRIFLRAKRYAVKLFLAHYHHVTYVHVHGTEPPLPYPVVHLGHAHVFAPPAFKKTGTEDV